MNLKYMMGSEAAEQSKVISWCRLREDKYPALRWIHHCPNGGSRNKAEAAKLKQEGVKSGVSDLNLPVGRGIYIGLYIEMKYRNGTLQNSQRDWLNAMQQEEHFVCTCYSFESAVNVIEEYVNLKPGWIMEVKNNSILK